MGEGPFTCMAVTVKTPLLGFHLTTQGKLYPLIDSHLIDLCLLFAESKRGGHSANNVQNKLANHPIVFASTQSCVK